MVGVAGRSKGCHTCKKRHLKCDEGRPECERCRKAGYTCQGYARALEFRISCPVSGSSAPNPKDLIAQSTTTVLPTPLSLVGWKENMQFAFLLDNFVWSSYGSPWLQWSAEGKLGALPHQACTALSQCAFGRHHAHRESETDAAITYGHAVSSLRLNLGKGGSELAEMLVPVLLLLLHASTAAAREESANHVRGLYGVLMACGPMAFQKRHLRYAFSSCRATLTIIGLLQRKRLFLESSAWIKGPWELDADCKTPQDILVDLLVQQPGLLQDAQGIEESQSPELRQNLVMRVTSQLEDLFRWRWEWELNNQHAAWESRRFRKPGSLVRDARPQPARMQLCFRSFSQAVEISLYNAVRICLIGLLNRLNPHFEASDLVDDVAQRAMPEHTIPQDNVLTLPVKKFSLHESAVEIARAFEYQLMNVHNCKESALFWLFPIDLARKVLEDDAPMMAWIQEMLDLSHVARGYGKKESVIKFEVYDLSDSILTER